MAIVPIRLAGADFQRVRLHRNNACYGFLLKVCRLVFDMLLPSPDGSSTVFWDVARADEEMPYVFEEFVRNFYRAEQSQFRVRRHDIRWDAVPLENTGEGRLPVMQTDITLESPSRRMIIDTKFYRDALQQRLNSSPSFRSENLYQLFSYLKNDAAVAGSDVPTEGMLIYPENGAELDGQFMIQGQPDGPLTQPFVGLIVQRLSGMAVQLADLINNLHGRAA